MQHHFAIIIKSNLLGIIQVVSMLGDLVLLLDHHHPAPQRQLRALSGSRNLRCVHGRRGSGHLACVLVDVEALSRCRDLNLPLAHLVFDGLVPPDVPDLVAPVLHLHHAVVLLQEALALQTAVELGNPQGRVVRVVDSADVLVVLADALQQFELVVARRDVRRLVSSIVLPRRVPPAL